MGAMDIGIDLGTTKIIIYKPGVGELLREPAVVAVNTKDDTLIAAGQEALLMVGKTPEYIRAEFPLENGVISNHVMTELMLKEFLHRACSSFLVKHRFVICVPSSVTEVERRAVVRTIVHAGVRTIYLIEEPIAAALGAGIDVMQPNGSLVVDIGGGTSDIAVISLGGVVLSESLRYAGNHIDEAIIKLMLSKYNLSIGKKMAQQIKQQIGNVWNPSSDEKTKVRGRNLLTIYPQQIEVSSLDIYDAVSPFAQMIVAAVKRVLDKTPPELASDIYENGITMTGGGSLLRGLPELLTQETGIKARVADNAIEAVSVGTAKAFEYADLLQTGFSQEQANNY